MLDQMAAKTVLDLGLELDKPSHKQHSARCPNLPFHLRAEIKDLNMMSQLGPVRVMLLVASSLASDST